jgi:hypothetical protein
MLLTGENRGKSVSVPLVTPNAPISCEVRSREALHYKNSPAKAWITTLHATRLRVH